MGLKRVSIQLKANNLVNDSKPRKRRRRDVENDLEEVYYKGSSSNSFYVIVLRNSPHSL